MKKGTKKCHICHKAGYYLNLFYPDERVERIVCYTCYDKEAKKFGF